MAPPRRLLLATTNPGKLREWRHLLRDVPFEVVSLEDVGLSFDVAETGRTFRENARLKVEAYGRASQLLTLAEDAGLAVAALHGGPGVRSARWEGDDYAHKNALLMRLVDGREGAARGCRYICVVMLRSPDGQLWEARGELRGQIAHAAAGSGGFGYDPVFYVPRLGRTLAEVSIDEKDGISHRGRAARRVRAILRQLVEAPPT
jgi:XTP/dITP diphosphohydrolase